MNLPKDDSPALHAANSPATTLYINGGDFELRPGDCLEASVVWSFFGGAVQLWMPLHFTLVEDRVLRVHGHRRLKRVGSPWRVRRVARATS